MEVGAKTSKVLLDGNFIQLLFFYTIKLDAFFSLEFGGLAIWSVSLAPYVEVTFHEHGCAVERQGEVQVASSNLRLALPGGYPPLCRPMCHPCLFVLFLFMSARWKGPQHPPPHKRNNSVVQRCWEECPEHPPPWQVLRTVENSAKLQNEYFFPHLAHFWMFWCFHRGKKRKNSINQHFLIFFS